MAPKFAGSSSMRDIAEDIEVPLANGIPQAGASYIEGQCNGCGQVKQCKQTIQTGVRQLLCSSCSVQQMVAAASSYTAPPHQATIDDSLEISDRDHYLRGNELSMWDNGLAVRAQQVMDGTFVGSRRDASRFVCDPRPKAKAKVKPAPAANTARRQALPSRNRNNGRALLDFCAQFPLPHHRSVHGIGAVAAQTPRVPPADVFEPPEAPAPPQQEIHNIHVINGTAQNLGMLAPEKRIGSPVAQFVNQSEYHWSMDLLVMNISPNAIKCLCTDWIVGGTGGDNKLEIFNGVMDLASSAFFRLKLTCVTDDFCKVLLQTLSHKGQYMRRTQDPNTADLKLAGSKKSFSAAALTQALLVAAGNNWATCPVELVVSNFGAKLDIEDWMARAQKIQQVHVTDVGPLAAASYAQAGICDIGLEVFTSQFIALTSSTGTEAATGLSARITDMKQFGATGKNFGGVMVKGDLGNNFNKFVAYNKCIADWKASGTCLRHGCSAVSRTASNRFLSDAFKKTILSGITALEQPAAADKVRFEIRSTDLRNLGSTEWLDNCKRKLISLANTLVALPLNKDEILTNAKQGFQDACEHGLFDATRHPEHTIDYWKYSDAARLAFMLGHSHVMTDAMSYALCIENSGWGPRATPVEEELQFDLQELPADFGIPGDYECEWRLRGDDAASIGHNAHADALRVDWTTIAGGDEDLARALLDLCLYAKWRRSGKNATQFCCTKKRGKGVTKNLGETLEEATVNLLKLNVPLSDLAKYS